MLTIFSFGGEETGRSRLPTTSHPGDDSMRRSKESGPDTRTVTMKDTRSMEQQRGKQLIQERGKQLIQERNRQDESGRSEETAVEDRDGQTIVDEDPLSSLSLEKACGQSQERQIKHFQVQ